MITHKELKRIARIKLRDARLLLKKKCYDSAMYLCGYSVEVALKAVICKSLKLKGVPSIKSEFETINQIKSHNFEQLLGLTEDRVKQEVKSNFLNEWGVIQDWDPEMRYTPISNSVSRKKEAIKLIGAAGKVYNCLRKYIS